MDVLKNYPINTLIVADNQTKGKGKGNRSWISQDKKNLYMSLKIRAEGDNTFNYVFVVGIVILETLKHLFKDINLELKWPNDLLLNKKKIAGILLERDLTDNSLVVGIGLNINSCPADTLYKATSLRDEGFITDKRTLVNNFINVFENYNLSSFNVIRERWLNYAYNLKNEIEVKIDDVSMVGIFEDLDVDGTLILKKKDGSYTKIISGDIF
jgi:BirA family biotin operon repressor/biotin-[acetyl-CoA-carboxylase] ligase